MKLEMGSFWGRSLNTRRAVGYEKVAWTTLVMTGIDRMEL